MICSLLAEKCISHARKLNRSIMLVSFLLVSLLFAGKIVCYESFDEFEDDESFAEASAKTL